MKSDAVSLLMKIIAYIFIFFLSGINIYSQEIGISFAKVWTDNDEIQNPVGFSVYAFQPVWYFGVKLEYLSANNERNYYGLLNGGFLINPKDFIQDSIFSKSNIQSIEVSLVLPRIFEVFNNYLNVGAGISLDKFSRDKFGINSGKKYSAYDSKIGIFYSISLSHENIFGLPVKIEVLFKHKGLMSGYYVTDVEKPFADLMDIKELQLNLGYKF